MCFFGHLATDSISWATIEHIKLTKDETTSSSRIFIKIMLNETAEAMMEWFKDDEVKLCCSGMFLLLSLAS